MNNNGNTSCDTIFSFHLVDHHWSADIGQPNIILLSTPLERLCKHFIALNKRNTGHIYVSRNAAMNNLFPRFLWNGVCWLDTTKSLKPQGYTSLLI